MPTRVADDRLPDTTLAVIVVAINESLVAGGSTVLGRGEDVDGFGGDRAVKVPDVDLAVVRA